MIKLTVQNYNGAPLPAPLSAQFDELGGTIGRADTNQLVLPDPERTISRVHAQIAFRGGSYAVVDRGSNPVQHNGRALGNGQEAPLRPGDQLLIGGYLIQVDALAASAGAASASADPFADLNGMAFASPAPASHGARASGASVDPLAAFGQASGQADPFGFGFGAAPAPARTGGALTPPPPTAPAPAAAAPAGFGGIPDDWDPFAPEAAAPAKPADLARQLGAGNSLGLELGGAAQAPLIAGLGDLGGGQANTASSLDAMFGLGASTGSDPFANSVLAQADVAPNMASHVDPMKALNTVTPVAASAAPDNTSMLNLPFMEAPLVPTASAPPAASPSLSPVLSWDDGAQDGRTVIRPKASRPTPPAAPAPAAAPAMAPAPAAPPVIAPTAVLPTAAVAAPPAPAGLPAGEHAASTEALREALRDGLGLPNLPVAALTPEFMRLLGQLLQASTQGTVDLLVARAALKREIRAEVTMIVAKENNPLKFSPSAEVALTHLLSPPVRGFMPAAPAMRDAFDDLRAHQFAFVAGMRAALEGVLQRFDPAELEGKLTQKSVLASLLPASRKARMWDVFTELYGQISAEASDDFHALFGKAFLQAYEAHIDQLQQDR